MKKYRTTITELPGIEDDRDFSLTLEISEKAI
jgi:hypothetical protein